MPYEYSPPLPLCPEACPIILDLQEVSKQHCFHQCHFLSSRADSDKHPQSSGLCSYKSPSASFTFILACQQPVKTPVEGGEIKPAEASRDRSLTFLPCKHLLTVPYLAVASCEQAIIIISRGDFLAILGIKSLQLQLPTSSYCLFPSSHLKQTTSSWPTCAVLRLPDPTPSKSIFVLILHYTSFAATFSSCCPPHRNSTSPSMVGEPLTVWD